MVRDDTARALQHRLETAQASSRVPSIAAGLVRRQQLVWFGSAGDVGGAPPTQQTQYRCGSISKTFIAVEVMRLRDEGAIDLSAPIGTYLPELGHLSCTVAHLLSHTSGLRAETSGPWWERTPGGPFDTLAATSIRHVDVLDRPGRRFHYSNVGFAVLGEMIARLRASAWDEVVDVELLRPLGMVRTTTRPVSPFATGFGVHPHADVVLAEPEHDAVSMAPAGQLWTTVDDLSRWAAVLSGRRPDVLRRETAEEMREPIALSDVPDGPWTAAHGLGVQVFNRGGARSYGHWGSMPGFVAVLRIEQATDNAVIVMTNATSGLDAAVESDLVSILEEHEPEGVTAWKPVPGGVPADVLDVTGAWYWGTTGFVMSIGSDGDLSLLALGAGRETAFRPAGDGTYRGLWGYYTGETLRIVRDGEGRPRSLDLGSFVLTRTPYDPAAEVPGGVDESGWSGSPTRPAAP